MILFVLFCLSSEGYIFVGIFIWFWGWLDHNYIIVCDNRSILNINIDNLNWINACIRSIVCFNSTLFIRSALHWIDT